MKKKWNLHFGIPLCVKKIGKMLRVCLFLMFFIGFSLWTLAGNQVKKMSVSLTNVTIDEIIRSVRKDSDLRFLYQVEEVNKYGRRDFEARGVSLNEFLDKLIKGTNLVYVIENKVIIIRTKSEEKLQTVQKTVPVSGKVLDNKGQPLPGATIVIQGTKFGVIADGDGKFSFDVSMNGSLTLVISFVGMQTKTIVLEHGKKTQDLIVRMEPDVTEIEEVVITGYGNVNRNSFTGNSVTVSKEDLMKVSKTNVIGALQTFDPSFRIQTNNDWGSDPNALPEMYIRGQSGIGGVKELDKSSLSKSALKDNPNLPTFIMDGFQISIQKLYDMDPSRIESITILKDAAATALYGSRAANGVVVITTVTPKPGKLNVSYNMVGELSVPDLRDYNMMNAREKLEAEVAAGSFEDDDPYEKLGLEGQYLMKLLNIQRGVDTYWLGLPLQTAFSHKHSLYVDGGSDVLRYGLQLTYHNEDGVMKESYRNRMEAGLYVDYRIGSFQLRNQVTYNITQSQETPYGLFSSYTSALPYDTYKDDNGKYLESLQEYRIGERKPNPLYESTLCNFNRSKYEELTNNLSANWYINNHLQIKGQFSVTRKMMSSSRFLDPLSKQNSKILSSSNTVSGELTETMENGFDWDMNAFLAYNRSLGKHNLNFNMGVNARSTHYKNLSCTYLGFPSGSLHSPNYAEKMQDKPVTGDNSTRLIGLLATLNYSYNNIYLSDASCRMDGSSEFGADERFAPFWSFGVGINIHNYEFMRDNGVVDQLKIRGSYGQTGKVNFPPYVARTTYTILTDEWYKTGFGGTLKALGNKKLTWETTNSLDVGVEMSFFKRLVYVKASYYDKKTVDLVNSVTIPGSTGFITYMDNIGEVRNRGVELDVRSDLVRRGDLYVAVFANMAHNKNKILKVAESLKAYNDRVNDHFNTSSRFNGSNTKPFTQYVEGGSLTSIFGVRSLGIDPATGNEIFLNQDGLLTHKWVASDQVVLGNREPKVQGTFGLNATYKNLSLYVTFMYEYGGQLYNQTLVDKVENVNVYTSNADRRVLTDRWKKPGDIAKFRGINIGKKNKSVATTRPTSRFVEDNNVLALNSATLGYDFNNDYKWMKQAGLSMIRLEVGMNDLFRWSTVKAERGLNYPYARKVNFSVKISF